MAVTQEKIKRMADMIEGRMSTQELLQIITGDKDPEAFDALIAYFQNKVEWKEPILLPLTDHLLIVAKGDRAIVKCTCGHEFEDYRVNWKVKARVRVRDTVEAFQEIYPPYMHPDPDWQHLREYYCPGCYSLLEVETVPPGYPPVFDALPDLQTFYREWLGRTLPVAGHEFKDLTAEYIAAHFKV